MSDAFPGENPLPARMDRRVAIKWMLAAGAGALLADRFPLAAEATPGPGAGPPRGYGVDPDLLKGGAPGEFWPLTFSEAERRQAAALCDVIMPADDRSPCASALGVQDFIDEWVSAPYPANLKDRPLIKDGLSWLDAESRKRFGAAFADCPGAERLVLCEEIARGPEAGSEPGMAPLFFRRFRNLTMAGFYSTPVGMKDLGYVGNVPLPRFEGPPQELIEKLGLSDEVKW